MASLSDGGHSRATGFALDTRHPAGAMMVSNKGASMILGKPLSEYMRFQRVFLILIVVVLFRPQGLLGRIEERTV